MKVMALGRVEHYSTKTPLKHLAFTVEPQVWESCPNKEIHTVTFHQGLNSQIDSIMWYYNTTGQGLTLQQIPKILTFSIFFHLLVWLKIRHTILELPMPYTSEIL